MLDIKQKLLDLSQKEKKFKQQYKKGLVDLENQLEENTLSITAESLSIKQEFVKFINDESIPLRERWDFFINAPDTVKEQKKEIPDGKSDGIEYLINQIAEEYSKEEFKKFYTADLINEYFNIEDIEETGNKEELYLYESAIKVFLKENCGSFVFTW